MSDTDYDAEVEHFSRINGWLGKKEKDEYFEHQRIKREQEWEEQQWECWEDLENIQFRNKGMDKEFETKQITNMIEKNIKQIGIFKQANKRNNMKKSKRINIKMSISSDNKEVIEKTKDKEKNKICTNLCDLCIQLYIRVRACIV